MWLDYWAAGGVDWTPFATVVAALVALFGVILTVVTSLRSSSRAEESKREAEQDARADAEVARLMTENTALRMQRDAYWEQRNQLADQVSAYRRWIWAQGCSPDEATRG